MTLLQMSFMGAVLILVVTVIRTLAIHRLPKKTFGVLWKITLLRLLIPVSFPSMLSVYSLLGRQAAGTVNERACGTNPLPMVSGNQLSARYDISAEGAFASGWLLAWLAGAALCAWFFAASYWRCRREFQTALPIEHCFIKGWLSTHKIKRHLDIRQLSRISAPLTYGIFHPVILLPRSTDWNDKNALKYVLEHEYVHIRHFDTGTKLILTIALCVHWFNPLVWVMYILANRDIELSCDEEVIHRFGESTRSVYARTLVQMEESKSKAFPLCSSFSKNAIEERIVAIMKTKKTTAFSLTAAILLVTVTTAAFATSALADAPNSDGQTTENATVIHIQKENGSYRYLLNDGRILDEAQYEKEFPTPDIEWWTYEEYKEWLEEEKKQLQQIIGEKAWANGKEFIWTQEMVDETIAMHEGFLQDLKEGKMLSKTVDGGTDMMIGYDPSWSVSSQGHELYVSLKNGEESLLGPYETRQELLAAAKPFCQRQVELGNMDQQEFDSILSDLEGASS